MSKIIIVLTALFLSGLSVAVASPIQTAKGIQGLGEGFILVQAKEKKQKQKKETKPKSGSGMDMKGMPPGHKM